MGNNKFLLNINSAKKTALNNAYQKHIQKIINNFDEDMESRWEIYEIITNELINDGKSFYLDELKYRISDGENPNKIFLDIIDREGDSISNIIYLVKNRLEEFLDEDFIKRFYI